MAGANRSDAKRLIRQAYISGQIEPVSALRQRPFSVQTLAEGRPRISTPLHERRSILSGAAVAAWVEAAAPKPLTLLAFVPRGRKNFHMHR